MRALKLFLAVALAAVAFPPAASAAGFAGTYSGASSEGADISVELNSKGELKTITGAVIRTLTCRRHDGSKPPPDDNVQLPDRNGSFAIDTTIRGNLGGSQFFVGTPDRTSGDGVESSAEGRFGRTPDHKSFITLKMSYDEFSGSGPQQETRCAGFADATLNLTGAASTGRSVKLRAPKNLRGTVKASIPQLASLGDDGIGISARTSRPAAGGTISVSVRRDKSVKDSLGFGSGTLGSESKTVSARSRRTSFTVDVKRPRKTPSSGDSVPMLVTVEFEDKHGRTKSATTKITLKG